MKLKHENNELKAYLQYNQPHDLVRSQNETRQNQRKGMLSHLSVNSL